MTILVTGVAGFIGYHLAYRLLSDGHRVYGIDNLNDYYDVRLKQARLSRLMTFDRFEFDQLDISDGPRLMALFRQQTFDRVVHLAAQAGCATRCAILRPTCRATWWGLPICWRAAAIASPT